MRVRVILIRYLYGVRAVDRFYPSDNKNHFLQEMSNSFLMCLKHAENNFELEIRKNCPFATLKKRKESGSPL